MPETMLLGAATALWIGIMTSISPCPLATNIAAISYISRELGNSRRVFLSGLFYTTGRSLIYLIISVVIVAGLLSAPGISMFLQLYFNKIVGPTLIIVGMFLLGLVSLPSIGGGMSENAQKAAARGGAVGAGLLGMLFALSFCPISAALFFGALIPLAVKFHSSVIFPVLYGIGTGLPVVVFAGIIAFSAGSLGKAFDALVKIDLWMRRIVGAVFIGAGIYMTLKYVFYFFG
ncbi:MAG TPA: aromatic aminobenezylarsenical efflux permease ArsG family transporter [bacterium]|nr:aromatic aminobenezylarsenical efflux permease ArsG family transporter [bacterium]HPN93357.1 aromatic aminobenezylarsenical efflux permease ArsG family transporter [bacterium]